MKKRLLSLLFSFCILISLLPASAAAAGTSSGIAEVTAAGTEAYSQAMDVFELVNENRAANGAGKLSFSATLTELAMQRAAEIAVYYSHTRPDGTDCFTVADGIYTGYSAIGENIAAGQTSAAAVMNDWMNSQGHRDNILCADFTQIGVGCFVSNGIYYWVQLFGNSITDTAVTTRTTDRTTQVPVRTLTSHLSLSPASMEEKDIALDESFTTALVNGNLGTGESSYFTAILIPETVTADSSMAEVSVSELGTITVTPKALGECTLTLRAYEGQSEPSGYRFNIVEEVFYKVILNSCEGGSAYANYASAPEGTTIKITYYPDEGYELTGYSLGRTDGGYFSYGMALNYFQFRMPACDVEFTPVFTKTGTSQTPFTDITEGAYYYDAVLWAVDEGITTGLSDTTFGPNQSCTRAQVVTFLWRAAGEPAPTSDENPFVDLRTDKYYYDAVLWAVEEGITEGYGSADTFCPDRTCSRAEIVTFLWRYAGKPKVSAANPFEDVPDGKWYCNAVLWAASEKITEGHGSPTTFCPDLVCTRGQIVTFLYRSEN